MSSTQISSPSFWLLFGTSIGLTVALQRFFFGKRQQDDASKRHHDDNDDTYYLGRAHQLRRALTKPAQSRFRVVAILLLDNGEMIFGANDEAPPTISGSLCAERGAFLQYRLQQYEHMNQAMWPKICKIYIVTDANVPIPPGLLCREYMYGHPAMTGTVPIVLQSADETSKPWITNLQELYPYPSLYMKLSVKQQLKAGPILAKKFRVQRSNETDEAATSFSSQQQLEHVLRAAHNATRLDNRDSVHPMRYGAAALVREKKKDTWHTSVVCASQRKALEYGATQDAVAQLLSLLMNRNQEKLEESSAHEEKILLLAQVDQFGLVHPPFAVARSLLVEHGWGHVQVVVPENTSATSLGLLTVSARVLAPSEPIWK